MKEILELLNPFFEGHIFNFAWWFAIAPFSILFTWGAIQILKFLTKIRIHLA